MRFYEILAIIICLPDDSRQTQYSDHGPPRTLPTLSSLRLQDCRITVSMFEPVFWDPSFPRSGARYNIDCHLEKSLTWSFLLKPDYPERFDIRATVTGVGGVPAPFGLTSDFRDCRMGLSRFGSWWSWSLAHPFLDHEMRHNIDCHIDEESVEETWPFSVNIQSRSTSPWNSVLIQTFNILDTALYKPYTFAPGPAVCRTCC